MYFSKSKINGGGVFVGESIVKVVIFDNLKLIGGIVGLAQLIGGRVVFFQVEDNRWRGFRWRIHWESCDF